MKKLVTHLTITTMVVLLLLSSTGNFTSALPSNTLQTGDMFRFTSDGGSGNVFSGYSEIYNSSNPSYVYRIDENLDNESVISSGDADIFVARGSANLQFPPEFDTLISVNSWEETQSGSQRNGYSNTFDVGMNSTWMNETYPVEDLSGRHYGNDRDNLQGFASNSTYAFIFPDMEMDNYFIDFFNGSDGNDPFFLANTFDGNIPLTTRTISQYAQIYDINGQSFNLNVLDVVSQFDIYYTETYNTTVPFGDEFDPNTPWVEVTVTLDLWISLYYQRIYDSVNGLLVETYEDSSFDYDVHMENSNFSIPPPPGNVTLNEGGPTTDLGLFFDVSLSSFDFHSNEIYDASAFYGRDRPVSQGNNRIEEGDVLKYYFETNSYEDNFMSSIFTENFNGTTTQRSTYDQGYGEATTEGLAVLETYRHSPGMWEAIMIVGGQSVGNFSQTHEEWDEFGNPFVNTWNETFMGEYFQVNPFMAASSAQFEIQPFFQDMMFINYDMNKEGQDGGINFDFPREIPKDGPAQVYNWEYVFNASEDDQPVNVNGFDWNNFMLEVHQQDYSAEYHFTNVEVFVNGPEGNFGSIFVNLDIYANGRQMFYYEDTTGAMIAYEERTDLEIDIYGSGDVPGPNGNVNVNLDGSVYHDDSFFLLLTEHPKLYTTGPPPPPSTTTTPTTTVPPTTSTTSSTPVSDNNDTSSGLPDLVPVEFAPIAFSLGVAALVVRRRKFN